MEFLFQKMSESNQSKAVVSVLLSVLSFVILLVAFHLNFQQQQDSTLSGSITPPAFSAEISE
jgi:ABC-type Fe3+ transport system permease subunit